ncbi:Sjogren's syndrome/scleroderma autoantigen 1 family protein [Halorussus ruber]|uniref:Sjogren's syndrome/scleroderma autoantigen 1 family protein n=1 Tax=Halorussus ruber TaxID=1126238 RepID=UPI0010920D91|nr:Sjogren's syndrome/scleroderma autoantigen 1 family protein [Halorussus ruber]
MSSDDSGFDKEAEREKLREKYGDDEEDRENTRRMSELLLQGATMTGKHCDNCGDPIFRYDGQEFCPTCQHEAREQAQGQSGEAQSQPDAAQSQPAEAEGQSVEAEGQSVEPADREVETPLDAASESETDDEPRVEINDVRVADKHADRSSVRRPPSQTDDRHESSADDSRRRVQVRPDQQGRSRRHDHTHDHNHVSSDRRGRDAGKDTRNVGDSSDLGPAREALVRKLTDLARTAEETDDVARSRELLAATREAAEALAALDRANR